MYAVPYIGAGPQVGLKRILIAAEQCKGSNFHLLLIMQTLPSTANSITENALSFRGRHAHQLVVAWRWRLRVHEPVRRRQ